MTRAIVVLFSFVALVAGARASAGQEVSRGQEEVSREEALARELLEVSGAGELGLQVVRQMVQSLAASNPEAPQEFWDRFVAEVDPAELEEQIVPIYTKHLTAAEMEASIAFYRTPEGQSILRKMPVVMAESMQAGQEWGMEVARRAMERLEAREEPPPEPAAARPAAPDAAPVHVEGLGAIAFPNSGAPEAQEAFRRGVLLLHSFEYGPAAEAFREAQAIDPDFALAYWGEAMTYNHPLWRQQDRERALATLERLAPTPEARRETAPTERERMYLEAVETLYSREGSKQERDREYMRAMERLHRAYPDDDEARAFYALSILGSEDGSRDFATYMRAAATAQPVFERNPLHPGAAHYIIHSFDDPIHAPLGLPAAEAYADIAPHAAHAQHMTSHIFVALGLWERAAEANVRARDTQDAERVRAGGKPNVCGHYSSWLHYAYLQLGEINEAEELMNRCHRRVLEEATRGEWEYFTSMRARHVVDTEEWQAAERWTVPLEELPDGPGWSGYAGPRLEYRITDALAGLRLGEPATAWALVEGPRPETPGAAFQIDQLAGLLALREGRTEEGVALLRRAAEAEEALPLEFGPPRPVKPTHELLGEALEDLGREEEAAAAFRRAVERTPGRILAVQGLDEARGGGSGASGI